MPLFNFFFFFTVIYLSVMDDKTSDNKVSPNFWANSAEHRKTQFKKSHSNRIITTDNTIALITGQRNRQSLFLRRQDKMYIVNGRDKLSREIHLQTNSFENTFDPDFPLAHLLGVRVFVKKRTCSHCNQTRRHWPVRYKRNQSIFSFQKRFGFLYKRVRTNGAVTRTLVARSILESLKGRHWKSEYKYYLLKAY